jgi:hypothetical protein
MYWVRVCSSGPLREFFGRQSFLSTVLGGSKDGGGHVGAPSSPLCKRGWFLCCAFLGDALQVIQALSAAPPHLHSIGYFVESIHQELRPSCDDPFFFIYTKHFININLLKYNWIFTVARRYVAKPTYGTYPIICTWQIRV